MKQKHRGSNSSSDLGKIDMHAILSQPPIVECILSFLPLSHRYRHTNSTFLSVYENRDTPTKILPIIRYLNMLSLDGNWGLFIKEALSHRHQMEVISFSLYCAVFEKRGDVGLYIYTRCEKAHKNANLICKFFSHLWSLHHPIPRNVWCYIGKSYNKVMINHVQVLACSPWESTDMEYGIECKFPYTHWALTEGTDEDKIRQIEGTSKMLCNRELGPITRTILDKLLSYGNDLFVRHLFQKHPIVGHFFM